MRIRVSVQTKHFFGNTNTQKMVAKEKNLCTEEKLSFVYLCIDVLGQRNHSLSVRYSCAVVLVFWLWREIVLKMKTSFYKKNLLGYLFMIR